MKKKRITYGVRGMMEYQTVVKVGKRNVNILFTDGSMNAMGMNPAVYSTDNIILQHAIENCQDFKRGRIQIVNTIELDEELKIERNEPFAVKGEKSPQAALRETDARETSGLRPQHGEEAEISADASTLGSVEADPQGEVTPAGSQQAALPEADRQEALTQVEFSCNDDAKDYLEQEFGFVRSKLRNREDIVNAGRQRGVEIIFV